MGIGISQMDLNNAKSIDNLIAHIEREEKIPVIENDNNKDVLDKYAVEWILRQMIELGGWDTVMEVQNEIINENADYETELNDNEDEDRKNLFLALRYELQRSCSLYGQQKSLGIPLSKKLSINAVKWFLQKFRKLGSVASTIFDNAIKIYKVYKEAQETKVSDKTPEKNQAPKQNDEDNQSPKVKHDNNKATKTNEDENQEQIKISDTPDKEILVKKKAPKENDNENTEPKKDHDKIQAPTTKEDQNQEPKKCGCECEEENQEPTKISDTPATTDKQIPVKEQAPKEHDKENQTPNETPITKQEQNEKVDENQAPNKNSVKDKTPKQNDDKNQAPQTNEDQNQTPKQNECEDKNPEISNISDTYDTPDTPEPLEICNPF